MRRVLISVAMATVAATLAASAAAAASPTEYRTQANALCRAADRATDRLFRPLPRTRADFVRIYVRSLAIVEALVTRLERLSPPDALAAGHRQAMAGYGRVLGVFRRIVAEMRAGGDPDAIVGRALPRLNKIGRPVDAHWRRVGARACLSD
jgi:hypothetical protein